MDELTALRRLYSTSCKLAETKARKGTTDDTEVLREWLAYNAALDAVAKLRGDKRVQQLLVTIVLKK